MQIAQMQNLNETRLYENAKMERAKSFACLKFTRACQCKKTNIISLEKYQERDRTAKLWQTQHNSERNYMLGKLQVYN